MNGVQCEVFTVYCSKCSVHCAVCSVQCAVCSVQCSLYSVQCAAKRSVAFGLLHHSVNLFTVAKREGNFQACFKLVSI